MISKVEYNGHVVTAPPGQYISSEMKEHLVKVLTSIDKEEQSAIILPVDYTYHKE